MPTTTFPIQDTKQVAQLTIAIVFAVVTLLSVGLRIWARNKLGRALDASDYLMLASTTMMLAVSASIISATLTAGLGLHVDTIADSSSGDATTPEKKVLQHLLAIRISNTLGMALIKVSILALCCKVFTVRWFRTAAVVAMGLISFWAVGTLAVLLAVCRPLAYSWDRTVAGSCGPELTLLMVSGIYNIATDFIVLVLPMPYLWKLDMTLWKRVTLIIAFGLGFIVTIISSIKVALLPTLATGDAPFSFRTTILLTMVESSLAIILANVPVLRPLFKHHSSSSGVPATRPGSATLTIATQHAVHHHHQRRGFSALYDHDAMPSQQQRVKSLEAGFGGGGLGRAMTTAKEMDEAVELGGIVVKTEFTARIDRVEPGFAKESMEYHHARVSG